MAVITITQENFEEKVLKSAKPVLLDFWATWCMPCRMLAPTVEEISAAHPELVVGKVNVDEEPVLAQKFGVVAIPMLALVRDGKVSAKTSGLMLREEIERKLQIL